MVTNSEEECSPSDKTVLLQPEISLIEKSIEDHTGSIERTKSTMKEESNKIDKNDATKIIEQSVTREDKISLSMNSTTNSKEIPLKEDTKDEVVATNAAVDADAKTNEGTTGMRNISEEKEPIVASSELDEAQNLVKDTTSIPKTKTRDNSEAKEATISPSESEEPQNLKKSETPAVSDNISTPENEEQCKESSSINVATTHEKIGSLKKNEKSSADKNRQTTNNLVVTVQTNVVVPEKFVHDPNKLTLKFLFANRDGLNVTCDCSPSDTVGEVKGLLLSMWPEELPACTEGDQIRLICMGKGLLMPDTRTLEDCNVPMFSTHPTPVNVSLKPSQMLGAGEPTKKSSIGNRGGSNNDHSPSESIASSCCVIL